MTIGSYRELLDIELMPIEDKFTRNHLATWIDEVRGVYFEKQVNVAKLMVVEYLTDPEYYDVEGWDKLYDNIII